MKSVVAKKEEKVDLYCKEEEEKSVKLVITKTEEKVV